MFTPSAKHWAYNLETGEVLGSSTGNGLRRMIKRSQSWQIRYGYGTGKWRFSHGAYAGLRFRALGA